MSVLLDKMKSKALSLSLNDRAELAHELIISLEKCNDPDAGKAWEVEINKRVKEIKNGIAKGRPAEQILAEIRAKYQGKTIV